MTLPLQLSLRTNSFCCKSIIYYFQKRKLLVHVKLEYLFLPVLLVVVFSCSKENETMMIVEDEDTNEPPLELKLDSVVVEQLLTNEVDIYRFNESRLTSVNDKVASYADGRVVRLESDNQVETFVYDNQGRLTRFEDYEGGDLLIRNITYPENEIRIQQQLITPIEVVNTSVTFFLDDNMQVIKEEYTNQFNEVFTADLSYDDAGNLLQATGVSNVDAFQYSYNETEVSTSYGYLSLLFGPHWKHNALIYKGRVIRMIADNWLIELANTYPVEHQVLFPGGSILTNAFTYEFDDNGNVLSRSEFNNDGDLDTRTTYEYE